MGGSEQHPTCPLSARFISSSAALGRSASASGLSPVSAASSEKQESTQSGVKWQRQVPLVEQKERKQPTLRSDQSLLQAGSTHLAGLPTTQAGTCLWRAQAMFPTCCCSLTPAADGPCPCCPSPLMRGQTHPRSSRARARCRSARRGSGRPGSPGRPWCASTCGCGRCRRSAPGSRRWGRRRSASPAGGGRGEANGQVTGGSVGGRGWGAGVGKVACQACPCRWLAGRAAGAGLRL